MKRHIALILLALVVAAGGCAPKTQTLKPLATALADKLGRTPANNVVEFETCDVTVCAYSAYFTTADNFPELDVRVSDASGPLGLTLTDKIPLTGGNDLLGNMNGELSRTAIKGRLEVISGTNRFPPSYSEWRSANTQGNIKVKLLLFLIRDSGMSYAFDGKSLTGNLMLVQTLKDFNQP